MQEFAGADGGNDNSVIANPESVGLVSKLLQLEEGQDLSFALTTLRTETRGTVYRHTRPEEDMVVCNGVKKPSFEDVTLLCCGFR